MVNIFAFNQSINVIFVSFCNVSLFFLLLEEMVTAQIFRNISGNEPSTPERDRMSERERSRIENLNMTSTDDRRSRNRNRSGTPPQGAPAPQPVFVNQHMGAGPSAHLGYPVPSVAAQYPQAGFPGPASVLPQHVSGDVFGVGLHGPARYTAPAQNAQAGPSHQRPPQMFPQPQPYMNPPQGVDFRYPMQAPMPPPQRPEFIDLGDDGPPQRQMSSGWDPSGPAVPSDYRTMRSVRSDPAFNNIHHGHIAYRGREATH